jgi:hypothetical protein
MDKIPIDQIKRVESAGFRKKKIFYRIKEWKTRDLLEVKSESEYAKLHHVYKKMEFRIERSQNLYFATFCI